MDVPLLGCDGAHVDFLAIDDLLDFSNDDISEPIDSCLTTTCTDSSAPSSEESKPSAQESSPPDKGFSLQPSLCGFDSDELCVPCDDLAELEWLSNFVEESFSTGDHAPASFCLGYEGKSATENYNSIARRTEQESHSRSSPVSVLESNTQSGTKRMCFNTAADMAIPARARTKRGRTAVCFWNTRILSAEASESLLDCSSTASTITSDSDMINAYYEHDDDDEDYEQDEEEDNEDDDDDNIEFDDDRMGYDCQYKRPPSSASPAKKKKKFGKGIAGFCSSKPKKLKVQEGEQQQEQRKCLHCASTKTPQWRAGPMGPKTLCNACGVRYKSGRLCAEYRPAASPTFIESVHSNSHRKVMEMRRQRGVGTLPFRSAMAEPQCCPDGGDQ